MEPTAAGRPRIQLTRKNIFILITLLVALIALPVGLYIVQQQQKLKSEASEIPGSQGITVTGGATCDAGGNCTATSNTIDLEISAPSFAPSAQ